MFDAIKGYIAAALGIIIVALAGALLLYWGWYKDARAEAATANAALAQVTQANAENLKTIERITVLNNVAAQITADTNKSVADINKSMADTKASISELKETNAQIKDFLDNGLPDSIRGLLNNRTDHPN